MCEATLPGNENPPPDSSKQCPACLRCDVGCLRCNTTAVSRLLPLHGKTD